MVEAPLESNQCDAIEEGKCNEGNVENNKNNNQSHLKDTIDILRPCRENTLIAKLT